MHTVTNKKEDCSGCGACTHICPKKCIAMREDAEGFLYPFIDKSACINCRLCNNVCPVLSPLPQKRKTAKTYIVQNKDEQVRRESTSGGAFSAIAEHIIGLGGKVWGVCLDENFTAKHTYAENSAQLAAFRGSKYSQSELGNTFLEVKNALLADQWALFSGTPCQVEGLLRYLGGDKEKLITVDVVCHGAPSPRVFKKYVEYQRQKTGEFDKLLFRDKYSGYTHTTMSLYKDGKCLYHNGLEYDPMLKLYFKTLISRPSCGKCMFKKINRASDFTLWDCYDVEKMDKSFDDNKGTSNVMLHTQKAEAIFEEIKKNFKYAPTNAMQVCTQSVEMTQSHLPHKKRHQFFCDLNKMEAKDLFKKWCPVTIGVLFNKKMRELLAYTGLYARVRQLAWKIKK
ncbi:MAG: Coenzyme F420 hydrogenase/dehydrogenase, beta subunit C-terminal domain [Oscillospiraceae bacterium]|jgi:NAD-dependent dihydropyrimidine dehydrogenase PreA subunit|nr:Coenzyme F420 hydrogenase/dehydrogenase, beta subunit C-terminal domain [Oscillospiraceae bacterium]